MTTVTDLLLNLVPVAVTIILTIILGGLVGNRLSVMWAIRQKRRELQLSAASQFYQLYGEFFAVWKLWSAIKDKAVPTDDSYPHDARWRLLRRASRAEGNVEAILVKITSERRLNNDGITTLARFRQAYQSLRQSIEANESLAWYSSDTAAYATFKQLANEVASLLVRDDPLHPPTPAQAVAAHRQITANKWEGRWIAKPMSMPEA